MTFYSYSATIILLYVLSSIISFVFVFLATPLAQGSSPSILENPFKLFIFEKSENSQNILVTHAELDTSCEFRGQFYDFYWMMDRVKAKNAHPLVKRGIRKRLKLVDRSERKIKLEVRGLSEFDKGMESASLEFLAQPVGSSCGVETVVHLKQVNQSAESIRLTKVYSETRKTWKPPFHRIESVILTGASMEDGSPVIRVIRKTKS